MAGGEVQNAAPRARCLLRSGTASGAAEPARPHAQEQPQRQSLTDQAYETLKWRILSMEIAPGSYLNELELCERYGFGRAPVHHALQRLKHDQLVTIKPRKGITVRSWSPRDVNDLIDARVPLESTTVRLAAERATREAGLALKKRLSDGPRLIARRDREGLIRLDRDFHLGLADLTGNRMLRDVVERLHQQSSILWFFRISSERTYETVQKQHEAILDRVLARDPDGAAAGLACHLEAFRFERV